MPRGAEPRGASTVRVMRAPDFVTMVTVPAQGQRVSTAGGDGIRIHERHQPLYGGIEDLVGRRVHPGEVPVGDRGSHEVRHAVNGLDMVLRTAGAEQRADGRAGDEDLRHVARRDVTFARCGEGGLDHAGKRVGAGPELDGEVVVDVPGRPRSAVNRPTLGAPPPNTSMKPPRPSTMSSLTVKPLSADSAACTPVNAAFAPMYSRAQLSVPTTRPPTVVAMSQAHAPSFVAELQ